jgi:hypothetical protein
MRFSAVLVLIAIANRVRANFFVYGRIQTVTCLTEDCANVTEDDLVGCPGSFGRCACFGEGKRSAPSIDWEEQVLPPATFRTKGICGTGNLVFHNRGNGYWEFYNESNGARRGDCREVNDGRTSCVHFLATTVVTRRLVCTTGVCE